MGAMVIPTGGGGGGTKWELVKDMTILSSSAVYYKSYGNLNTSSALTAAIVRDTLNTIESTLFSPSLLDGEKYSEWLIVATKLITAYSEEPPSSCIFAREEWDVAKSEALRYADAIWQNIGNNNYYIKNYQGIHNSRSIEKLNIMFTGQNNGTITIEFCSFEGISPGTSYYIYGR